MHSGASRQKYNVQNKTKKHHVETVKLCKMSKCLLSTYTTAWVAALCVVEKKKKQQHHIHYTPQTNSSDVKQLCGNSEKPKVTLISV